MQITPKEHPNEEGALNKYFIDDVKVDLYLCFKNITKEKKLFKETKRKAAIKDVLDYYHAEVEILTMDLKARTKTVVFLLQWMQIQRMRKVIWRKEPTIIGL